MENVVFVSILAALVVGRVYLGHLAAEAIDKLPAEAKRQLAARRWAGDF